MRTLPLPPLLPRPSHPPSPLQSANLQFLKFPLVTHHSLLLDGLPPYLVLEAQRDVTRDYMRTLQQVEPSVIAVCEYKGRLGRGGYGGLQ